MMRAVLRLLHEWKLSSSQTETVLGMGAQDGVFRLPADEAPANKLATRLGYLLAIHSSLRTIFTQSDQAIRWMETPNTAFSGMSALDVIIADQESGMVRLLKYLAAGTGVSHP